MGISEKRKGELFIFPTLVIWALFPIVTTLSFAKVPSMVSFAWSIMFACVLFAAVVTYRRKWPELRQPLVWKYSFFVALSLGVFYYGLYFLGLPMTTPGNAAIIAQFEVLTTVLFFNVIRREAISGGYVLGAALMVLGALIVLEPNFSGINGGDLLILLATFATPIGNLYQQKARAIASSEIIMFLRSALSLPFIFLLAYASHADILATDIRPALPLIALNGLVLLGLSKIFWIEGIHRMQVTKASALTSLSPFVTLLFAWLILHQAPSVSQLAALLVLVPGVLLLTDQIRLKGR